jgi:hypothetical protein
MKISRTGLMAASLALVVLIAGAQTKQPAKKSSAKAAPPAAAHNMVLEPGSEQWGDIPAAATVGTPSVEMGGTLKVAIIQGDPMAAGRTYTLRLSCTDGLKIAPHWHPTTENVTVIKGGAAVGMGSKWDDAAMKDVPVGGFFSAAPQMRHYAQCKGDSVLQVHGVGPFVINFVAPDEAAAEKKQ